mmetsp:Transcript_132417/g.301019  ORF Transcript_132417/g.301019 Transcript_132417/m.301019 type:complete len:126 (+) Transcript_132417:70-447(+)
MPRPSMKLPEEFKVTTAQKRCILVANLPDRFSAAKLEKLKMVQIMGELIHILGPELALSPTSARPLDPSSMPAHLRDIKVKYKPGYALIQCHSPEAARKMVDKNHGKFLEDRCIHVEVNTRMINK